MNDIITSAWHALTPEQRPDNLEPEAGGWRYGSIRWEDGEAAVYALLCVACERVAHELGCSPYFRAKGQWGGDGLLGADRWSWLHGLTVIDHTCRLTAAVLAIEATKGGDDER